MSDEDIARAIVRLLSQRAAAASICPSEVARSLEQDDATWRALMPRVREVADALRSAGRLRITRGGVEVADDALHHGAIRLARGPGFGA